MAERWLRWYDGTVRDGKIRIVAGIVDEPVAVIIGVWASLLEDAATNNPRGVATKGIKWHSIYLELSEAFLGTAWNAMEEVGMVQVDGANVKILNWTKRQYESDYIDPTAKQRKQKWKQKHSSVGTVRNAQERSGTPETETETETETDILVDDEKDVSQETEKRTSEKSVVEEDFERFWKAYPKRKGSNPKQPAKVKFLSAVRNGAPSHQIVAAAAAYATEQESLGKVGTEYIAQAVTWLNQQRYGDYGQINGNGSGHAMTKDELDEHMRKFREQLNAEEKRPQ